MGKYVAAVAWAGAVLVALAVSGCGSSAPTVSAVSRAADVTAQVPGYRIAASMSVSTQAGPVVSQMSGVYDRATRSGTLTADETIAGRRLAFQEAFSGLTFYMRAPGLPQIKRLTGGKPWLKFDMSRALGAMGLGSLPTGTDPSQFVDYLRAVSSSAKRVGSATVRGVPTTHYRAVIDLRRYPQLVGGSQRAAANRGVSALEAALGGDTLPMDVWIDRQQRVRRISFAFRECVSDQRLVVSMTEDLYDYGAQPATRLPSAADSYDITPLLSSELSQVKFGCSSS